MLACIEDDGDGASNDRAPQRARAGARAATIRTTDVARVNCFRRIEWQRKSQ